ncbi:MAG: nucleoside triphosphate pyrophosphohydrolase [Steroidobacteraceae bacterium]
MSKQDGAPESLDGLKRLLEVMRRLRDPASGCPWDLAQDSRSLARYALEEAYEVVSAIESGSNVALRDELGDLLFQVVFHAQLGAEQGNFNFNEVATGIASKLTHRHPHVFGHAGIGDNSHWESIKADERAARGATGALDDVPLALPALMRATKLGKRAAVVGFDWPDESGPHAKVLEELAEVEAARQGAAGSTVEDELGDLLLAVTSYARHLKVDPETALRRANTRFEQRFRAMEQLALHRGLQLAKLAPEALDQLWEAVKKGVQS